MDKIKQTQLTKWLKQQSHIAKRWIIISILLGTLSGIVLLAQAALLAFILHQLIIESADKHNFIWHFIALACTIIGRIVCNCGKDLAGYKCGQQIRIYIRQLIIDKLNHLGSAYIQGKSAGSWATLILEQVEDTHDYFARYLPQMALVVILPFIILLAVFPVNWAAGIIFLITAPLVPLFMAFVGIKAADANRKNFKALQRLSGYFYDRLQAISTIRIFNRSQHEINNLQAASEVFRMRTMDVLKIAFLSSAVLEFFASISIAITAMYFGFSYIGELNFGYFDTNYTTGGVTLFAGLFILILAPEFYQPLRDLGNFYHAKQQAIGAAESIVDFLNFQIKNYNRNEGSVKLDQSDSIEITACDLIIFSHDGAQLTQKLNFTIPANSSAALIGKSGAGKTSLINAILGFMPYTGSLTINGIELTKLDLSHWRRCISWVGQNPTLVHGSLEENILLGKENLNIPSEQLKKAFDQAILDSHTDEIIKTHGLKHKIYDRMQGLSLGQTQRIALARAMLQHHINDVKLMPGISNNIFWLLDEPTASLDAKSEQLIITGINKYITRSTSLLVTHQLNLLTTKDLILVMQNGCIVQQGSYAQLKQVAGEFQTMLKNNLTTSYGNFLS